jgi:probable selenium-dependent hydroxylase accessory protein YqeC
VNPNERIIDLDALGLTAGAKVAIVGAGGKTALAWRLTRAALARGQRAIFTTTTRVWLPAAGAFDLIHDPTSVTLAPPNGSWRSAALLAREAPLNDAPVPGASMPTLQTKASGLTPEQVCMLSCEDALLVVEADGARGLRIKAPGSGEPQLPACTDALFVVACLDAIGRPLDDRVAHRVGQISALTSAMPGGMITASLIAALLPHPLGGLKNAPPTARKIAVLTQNGGALHADAHPLAADLRRAGFHRVMFLGASDADAMTQ